MYPEEVERKLKQYKDRDLAIREVAADHAADLYEGAGKSLLAREFKNFGNAVRDIFGVTGDLERSTRDFIRTESRITQALRDKRLRKDKEAFYANGLSIPEGVDTRGFTPTKVAAGLLKYDAEIGQNEASMLIPLSEVIQGEKTLSDVKNAGYVGISLERDGDKLTAFSIDTYDSQKRKIEGKSVIDSPVIQDKAQGFIKQVMGAEADIASLPQYAKYKLGVAPNPYDKLFDKLTYEDIQKTEGGYTTKLLTELDQIKDRAWKRYG